MSTHTKLVDALTSQVGRKLLTGITGVLLVLFIIFHLAGNLALLRGSPEFFNRYTHFLEGFGVVLLIIEILLGLVFVIHAWLGIAIWLRKRRARRMGYEVYKTKGGASRQTFSSRTMILTGVILLVFLVVHTIQFRFSENPFVTQLDGKEAADMAQLVVYTFSNIWWVIFYVVSVGLLGFHLRHGVWSAFQSLGAMKPRVAPLVYGIALILGAILAVGFLILPIWIYLQRGGV